MGNRLNVICFSSKDAEAAPVIYQHWAGTLDEEVSTIRNLLNKFREGHRENDVDYFAARLLGHFHNQTGGDDEVMSLGLYGISSQIRREILLIPADAMDHEVLRNLSAEDVGLIAVDVFTDTIYHLKWQHEEKKIKTTTYK